MRFKPLLIPLAMAGYAGLAAQSALAGPSGYPMEPAPPAFQSSVMIRIGAAYVEPEEDVFNRSFTFLADDPATEEVTESVPVDVGVDIDLDDETTWYISGVWIPIEHFGVELYYASEAGLEGNLYSDAFSNGVFLGDFSEGIGDFDLHITSLYANWYPLSANCLIQPYVGIGVSYVDFEHDNDFKQIRSVFGSGDTFAIGNLNLGSSFSWTAQIGVDFNFGPGSAWQVNLSAMYVDADPDFEIGFDALTDVPGFGESVTVPVRIKDELDLDPWMVNLGVGYKFSF